eukprot:TRINITY_DN4658_c0_g1_i1.p1 TRINITY_DN4658_c0_g1~~TRINITY_DN4658_c0_g1_i1.p1  ORF type:complete len:347 (-),score=19.11 TRINITY_DN4658_c0_g1_i1:28-1068(-)
MSLVSLCVDVLVKFPTVLRKSKNNTKKYVWNLLSTRKIKFPIEFLYLLVDGETKNIDFADFKHTSGWSDIRADDVIVTFCKKAPNLQSLSALCFKNISDITITELTENCPLIETLELHFCALLSDKPLESLVAKLSHLRILSLTHCAKLTDSSITAIATTCTNLQHITFTHSKITDKGVSDLVSICKGLKEINLTSSRLITDKSVTSISQRCLKLKSLNLSGCTQLSNTGFSTLVCFNLHSLNVSGCVELKDLGVLAFAQGCPFLTQVDIGYCKLITDKSVSQLSLRCPDLESVVLDSCDISDSSFKELALRCEKLKYVSLVGCKKITEDTLSKFRSKGLVINTKK